MWGGSSGSNPSQTLTVAVMRADSAEPQVYEANLSDTLTAVAQVVEAAISKTHATAPEWVSRLAKEHPLGGRSMTCEIDEKCPR